MDFYGLSLFGQKISVGRTEKNVDYDFTFFDNGYLTILVPGGIVIFLIMSCVLLLAIWHYSKRHVMLAGILVIFAIDGFMTNGFADITLNPFILAIGFVINGIYGDALIEGMPGFDDGEYGYNE